MQSGKSIFCCVTPPISEASVIPLHDLTTILCSISDKIYLISGGSGNRYFAENNDIHFLKVTHKITDSRVERIYNYLLTQIQISIQLIRTLRRADTYLFFLGEDQILPILIAKLFGKKVILVLGGSLEDEAIIRKDPLYKPLIYIKEINRYISSNIILYSPMLISTWKLKKYKNKICIAHHHYLNFDKFRILTPLSKRTCVVGYIGRFSEEKGILNFVKAILDILKKRNDINFFIGGDGQLRGEIEKYLNEHVLNEKVNLTGWISHDNLPQYFNELKLVVLPSFTEGLPNIMLEAMACGTPVLATPMGAIPDFIKDGETGFIMENNSPECIAQNVIRALNHPNLEQIANNGWSLVEKEFTFEKVVERYREILNTQ